MTRLTKIILSLLVAFIFSCKGKPASEVSTNFPATLPDETGMIQKQDTFKTGKIFQLNCLNDASKSYAVYLPESYGKNNSFPVIYFFDPHADGNLPVEKYKTLAKEFSWILVGCNNSKNGMQLMESQSAANSMISDAGNRFYINNKLQYVAGFSGGSKVACSLATTNNNMFAGLIACSGSFVTRESPLSAALNIASIAGERDFNYHEMVQFNESVNNTNPHLFITTDNSHEWPPVAAMKDAMVFMLMQIMKQKNIPENNSLVTSYFNAALKQATLFERQKDIFGYYAHLQNIYITFKGLADISSVEKKLADLEKSPELNSYLQKKKLLDMQENQLQQYYADAFLSRDLNWWNSEIGKLKIQSENKSDKLQAALNSRMLGFFGIMCYSYSGRAVKANATESQKFLSIYKTVEPDNAEAYFLSAVYAANNSNMEMAAAEIKEALQKGFSDKQRLNEYPSLANVIYRSDVKAILDTIH